VTARPPRHGDDDGSAIVEFLTVGVLLLVPTLYLVLLLGRLQAAAFATEAAARSAARAVTSAETERDAATTAHAVVGYALADQGFDVDVEDALAVRCPDRGCLTPGGVVVVTVQVVVPLVGAPGLLAEALPGGVPVSATHIAVVDMYRDIE
jgi:hypothetical protein